MVGDLLDIPAIIMIYRRRARPGKDKQWHGSLIYVFDDASKRCLLINKRPPAVARPLLPHGRDLATSHDLSRVLGLTREYRYVSYRQDNELISSRYPEKQELQDRDARFESLIRLQQWNVCSCLSSLPIYSGNGLLLLKLVLTLDVRE